MLTHCFDVNWFDAYKLIWWSKIVFMLINCFDAHKLIWCLQIDDLMLINWFDAHKLVWCSKIVFMPHKLIWCSQSDLMIKNCFMLISCFYAHKLIWCSQIKKEIFLSPGHDRVVTIKSRIFFYCESLVLSGFLYWSTRGCNLAAHSSIHASFILRRGLT